MEKIIRFYEERIADYASQRETIRKKIRRTGTLRLLLFVASVVAVWLLADKGWTVWLAIAVGFGIPFVMLMVYHSHLFGEQTMTDRLHALNQHERNGIDGDYSAFDGAPEQVDAQHDFGFDLDLFGRSSLFQCINRTVTPMGRARLIGWLSEPLTDRAAILERQQAVRELAGKPDFRQLFYATGIGQPYDAQDIQQLANLSTGTTHFSGSWCWKALTWIVPILWGITLFGVVGLHWPPVVVGLMVVVGFAIANWHAKQIARLHRTVDRLHKRLAIYVQLMMQVERETFDAPLLQQTADALRSDEQPASAAVKQLSQIIGGLDQRFNLALVMLNIVYLRDIRLAMQLERWSHRNAAHFDRWIGALADIDALGSLAGFAFNHPDYCYPDIVDRYFLIEGRALGHPLLPRDRCVRNDIAMRDAPCFMVVTGANMAGKSTWLRTVGVNFVLACVGVPVCAEALTVSPARLVTGLRTADSLVAGESYFFAELKRLKMIVDRLDEGQRLFVILDEILRGTNSKDKQRGSLALVARLIAKQTCGIIATHDLLLGTLADQFPEHVYNCCFEADISGDSLTFDYRLRRGIAQNMNASFLMKQMGITE